MYATNLIEEANMHLFLVLTRYTNGLHDERVFSSSKDAFAYLKRPGKTGASEILEIPVIGELETADTVYTVSWNDRTRDTQNFEGMYGGYLQAKKAVGQSGQVLRRTVHLSGIDADAQSILDTRRSPIEFRYDRAPESGSAGMH